MRLGRNQNHKSYLEKLKFLRVFVLLKQRNNNNNSIILIEAMVIKQSMGTAVN